MPFPLYQYLLNHT